MAMEFDGEFEVATGRENAYRILSDVNRFAPLLPTYQSHEARDDGTVDVKVKVGVGKIRGNAVVNLELIESRPPESATYAGKGKMMGGAFNLIAAFDLVESAPNETKVHWRGGLTILGKLVSLAGGLIRPVAKKEIQHLVDAIKQSLDSESQKAGDRQSNTAKT
jgi:carbon monoxide dehydrogenase subunit G